MSVEPWLRGTHGDVEPIRRAVLHALELAREDIVRWSVPLPAEELERRPFGLPSVGFQMRHIARSLDRLMTYAEGRALSLTQHALLQSEDRAESGTAAEFQHSIDIAIARLLAFAPEQFAEPRSVGRDRLPTTVAGLLIHVAEHTQRHVGQAVTTAKLVMALREAETS